MNKAAPWLYIFLIASLACCLAPSKCPSSGDLTVPDKPDKKYPPPILDKRSDVPLRSIANRRLGLSLKVPQDWEVNDREHNPVLFAVAPDAGTYGPMANLVIEELNNRINPFDYQEANIITMQASIQGLEVKWRGMENAGGASTAWIQYTYNRGGTQVEAISYCQTREFRAYVITCVAPAASYPEIEPLFREIGRSLRIGKR